MDDDLGLGLSSDDEMEEDRSFMAPSASVAAPPPVPAARTVVTTFKPKELRAEVGTAFVAHVSNPKYHILKMV